MLLALLMSLFGGSIDVGLSGVTELRPAAQAAGQFSYDATEPKGRRKSPTIDRRSEDLILDSTKRAKVQASASDIARNFALARWMIRKHLDFVTTFEFQSLTGDDTFDEQVEALVARRSLAENCDRAARHPLWRILRLTEALRTIHGDSGLLKLGDGRLQGIESDRIRNPSGSTFDGDKSGWVHGVKVDAAGKAYAYSISRRTRGGGFEFERAVPAANFLLHGYFDRFDQVRGISPIVAALDPLRDVYENFTLALAKAKVEQLFALAFFRKASDAAGDLDNSGDTGFEPGRYTVDFGGGPVLLDLEPGDDAKFLASSSPHSNFQSFTQLMIAVAMKALDLPYIFADEGAGVFHSFRGSWLIYDRACECKRAENAALLSTLTRWWILLAVLDGELALPRGMDVESLPFAWHHRGLPWFDPSKELAGDLAAIQGGFDNPQRITQKRGGGDWYANIDLIAKARDYAEAKGVQVSFDPPPEPAPEPPAEEVKSGK